MSHITTRSSRPAAATLPGAALTDEIAHVEGEKGRHTGTAARPRRNCSINTATLAAGRKRPKDSRQDCRWLYQLLVTSRPRYRECKAANCAHCSLQSRHRQGHPPLPVIVAAYLARMCEPVHTCSFLRRGVQVGAGKYLMAFWGARYGVRTLRIPLRQPSTDQELHRVVDHDRQYE
jgi:hypothetical protein